MQVWFGPKPTGKKTPELKIALATWRAQTSKAKSEGIMAVIVDAVAAKMGKSTASSDAVDSDEVKVLCNFCPFNSSFTIAVAKTVHFSL